MQMTSFTIVQNFNVYFRLKMGQRIIVMLTNYSTIKNALSKLEFSERPNFFTLKVFRKFQNKGELCPFNTGVQK